MGTKRKVSSGSICSIHGIEFVQFGHGRLRSYGCPMCVDLIREQVRKERANYKHWHGGAPKDARTRMRPGKATG